MEILWLLIAGVWIAASLATIVLAWPGDTKRILARMDARHRAYQQQAQALLTRMDERLAAARAAARPGRGPDA